MSGLLDRGTRSQYLTLSIAEEQYAIPLLSAREIIRYESATRVPHAPVWIHGVINLRGLVLAVVDLSARFGLPHTVATPTTCVVVIEVSQGEEPIALGILADAVHEVIDLSPEQIQPTPSFGTKASAEFLCGVGVVDDRLTLLLDPERILLDDDERTLRALAGEAPAGGLPDVRTSPSESGEAHESAPLSGATPNNE